MNILITGGAGYIGSHMTKLVLDRGDSVVVADSLERGFEDVVDKRATLEIGDLRDKNFVSYLFSQHDFDAVIHFAAYIAVGESMKQPGMYFENNIQSAINLLDTMAEKEVKKFIFSSTGTVYGTPKVTPTPETHPKSPENPYAASKAIVEEMLHWYYKIYGISYMTLRYFNACGADLDAQRGELHNPETHLIPNAIQAAIAGTPFTLFGDDYDTPDGTCIRDYIHVLDLVDAHVKGLLKLDQAPGEYTYNVGTGNGFSNKQVLEMVEKVVGKKIDVVIKERRPGDVASTIADNSRIKKELGFEPRYSDLETIMSSAYQWHKKQKT